MASVWCGGDVLFRRVWPHPSLPTPTLGRTCSDTQLEGLVIDSSREVTCLRSALDERVNPCLHVKLRPGSHFSVWQTLRLVLLAHIIAANNRKHSRLVLNDHSHVYGQITGPCVVTLDLCLLVHWFGAATASWLAAWNDNVLLRFQLYQAHGCVSQVGKATPLFSRLSSASPLPTCFEFWTNESLGLSLTVAGSHRQDEQISQFLWEWVELSVPKYGLLHANVPLCEWKLLFLAKSIARGLIPWNTCMFHVMPVDPPMVWYWKAAFDVTEAAFDEVPTLKLLTVHIGTITFPLLGENSSVNQSQSTASFTWHGLGVHHINSVLVLCELKEIERRSTYFLNASSCLLFDPQIYYIMHPSGIKNSMVQMVNPQEPLWSMTMTAKQCCVDIWMNTVMGWTCSKVIQRCWNEAI